MKHLSAAVRNSKETLNHFDDGQGHPITCVMLHFPVTAINRLQRSHRKALLALWSNVVGRKIATELELTDLSLLSTPFLGSEPVGRKDKTTTCTKLAISSNFLSTSKVGNTATKRYPSQLFSSKAFHPPKPHSALHPSTFVVALISHIPFPELRSAQPVASELLQGPCARHSRIVDNLDQVATFEGVKNFLRASTWRLKSDFQVFVTSAHN